MTIATRRAGPPVVRDEAGLAGLRARGVTRALTLWPEWLAVGLKLDKFTAGGENRPRPPPASIMGTRIALHAGKYVGGRAGGFNEGMSAVITTAQAAGWVTDLVADGVGDSGILAFIKGPAASPTRVLISIPDGIVTSAIVATAKVAGYMPPVFHPTSRPWRVTSTEAAPSYLWLFTNIEILDKPIACPGMQGVWPL